MANVDDAIDYVLGLEDSTLAGKVAIEPGGERVRFGINEKWHPELTNCLFYTTMGREAALKIARGIYDISYCQPLCIEQIGNQQIANKLLSLGVNCGVVNAAKMLQESLTVDGDGRIGPITLYKLEYAKPEAVLADLCSEAEYYYRALFNKDPIKYKDVIAGWLARAKA